MQRVAKFEKVSFEQFKKDWADTFYVTDGIEKIYEDIKFQYPAVIDFNSDTCRYFYSFSRL